MSDSKDHSSTTDDAQLRAELGFDQQIDDLYAQMQNAQPPTELDAAIVASAQKQRQANPLKAGSEPADGPQTDRRARYWSNRGLSALASAAVLLLTVGVFLKQSEVAPQLRSDEVIPMPAPASARVELEQSVKQKTAPIPEPAMGPDRAMGRRAFSDSDSAEKQRVSNQAMDEPLAAQTTLALNQTRQLSACADINTGLCREVDGAIHFKVTGCETGYVLPFRGIDLTQLRVGASWIEYPQPGGATWRKAVCREGSWTQTEASP